jgi:hypothetical protein
MPAKPFLCPEHEIKLSVLDSFKDADDLMSLSYMIWDELLASLKLSFLSLKRCQVRWVMGYDGAFLLSLLYNQVGKCMSNASSCAWHIVSAQ